MKLTLVALLKRSRWVYLFLVGAKAKKSYIRDVLSTTFTTHRGGRALDMKHEIIPAEKVAQAAQWVVLRLNSHEVVMSAALRASLRNLSLRNNVLTFCMDVCVKRSALY